MPKDGGIALLHSENDKLVYWLIGSLLFLLILLLYFYFKKNENINDVVQLLEKTSEKIIILFDESGKIIQILGGIKDAIGYERKELISMALPYVFFDKKFNHFLKKILDEGSVPIRLDNPVIFIHKDGNQLFLNVVVQEITLQEKKYYVIKFAQKIDTESVHRELQELFKSFDHLEIFIALINIENTHKCYANKKFIETFGSVQAGFEELANDFLISAEEKEAQKTIMGVSRFMDKMEPRKMSIEKKIGPHWYQVFVHYLMIFSSQSAFQLLIAYDISKRKMLESIIDLQKEQVQAQGQLLALGEMTSIIAHELNQPLMAISNFAEGLNARIQGGLPLSSDTAIHALQKISSQAQRSGAIIQRLRDLVKKREASISKHDIQPIVQNAVELAAISCKRLKTRLRVNLAPGLPKLSVDALLIEQVLINLIRNAAESVDLAQREGDARVVDIKVHHNEKDVIFEVSDKGIGLTKAVQDTLFLPFRSTKQDGLGIGLSTCRSIIERHGGRIWAINNSEFLEKAYGATFFFTTPLGLHDQ